MEESTNKPAKKKNTGLIVGIVIAAVVVIVGIVIAVICCNQPKTLEDYYKKDAEFARQVDEVKSANSTDGVTTNITFNGNTMKVTFTLSSSLADKSDAIVQVFESEKSSIDSSLKPAIKAAENDGVTDVAITVEVVSNNKTVWTYTVK